MASNMPPPPPVTPPPAPPAAPQAQVPQYAPAPPPQPKKTSPWVWVLLGCLGVVVLALVALAAGTFFVAKKVKGFAQDAQKNPVIAGVEMVARFDPNIEVVSKDRNNDTITIRNKKTNETVTLNAENFKDGHISWQTDKGEGGEVSFDSSGKDGEGTVKVRSKDGEATFGSGANVDIPSWIPAYPGSSPVGTMAADTTNEQGGGFTFKTGDSVDDVLSYYKDELKSAGFEVSSSSWEKDGATAGGGVNGTSGKRTITVAAGADDGETRVNVIYRLEK